MKRPALFAALLIAAGCNGNKPAAGTSPRTSDKKAAPQYLQVNPATAASLQGTVRYQGKAHARKRISMDAEADCARLHPEPVYEERVRTGKQRGLANVFVYVQRGLEGKSFAPTQEAVILEQKGCQFLPRVTGLRTGQTLRVKNSDPVSHNIHPMPKNNRDWNQQQAPGAPDLQRRFGHPEVMIPVKCNIHAWMKSYIGVLEHPYYAVTNDGGEFVIHGLPPGGYTLAAWHEELGEITQAVTAAASRTVTVDFVFK
jgi:plastocyanin